MKPSLSIVLPIFNEASCLEATTSLILDTLTQECSSHELLLVDDGSTDQTSEIARKIATADPTVKYLRNEVNRGMGYSLRLGMQRATKDYVMYWSAGCELKTETLGRFLAPLGDVDMVVMYIGNAHTRPLGRRITSRCYTMLVNALFGLNMRYYNGAVVFPARAVQKVLKEKNAIADDYVFMAEILIRMIKEGLSYAEVPTYHRQMPQNSPTMYLKKSSSSLRTLARLFRVLA